MFWITNKLSTMSQNHSLQLASFFSAQTLWELNVRIKPSLLIHLHRTVLTLGRQQNDFYLFILHELHLTHTVCCWNVWAIVMSIYSVHIFIRFCVVKNILAVEDIRDKSDIFEEFEFILADKAKSQVISQLTFVNNIKQKLTLSIGFYKHCRKARYHRIITCRLRKSSLHICSLYLCGETYAEIMWRSRPNMKSNAQQKYIYTANSRTYTANGSLHFHYFSQFFIRNYCVSRVVIRNVLILLRYHEITIVEWARRKHSNSLYI